MKRNLENAATHNVVTHRKKHKYEPAMNFIEMPPMPPAPLMPPAVPLMPPAAPLMPPAAPLMPPAAPLMPPAAPLMPPAVLPPSARVKKSIKFNAKAKTRKAPKYAKEFGMEYKGTKYAKEFGMEYKGTKYDYTLPLDIDADENDYKLGSESEESLAKLSPENDFADQYKVIYMFTVGHQNFPIINKKGDTITRMYNNDTITGIVHDNANAELINNILCIDTPNGIRQLTSAFIKEINIGRANKNGKFIEFNFGLNLKKYNNTIKRDGSQGSNYLYAVFVYKDPTIKAGLKKQITKKQSRKTRK